MSEFKSGYIVKLKSGGPDMTIVKIAKYAYETKEQAKCQWFMDNELKEHVFSLDSLEIITN